MAIFLPLMMEGSPGHGSLQGKMRNFSGIIGFKNKKMKLSNKIPFLLGLTFLSAVTYSLFPVPSESQTLENFEILFQRTYWGEPRDLYGYTISTGGDINQDGYEDILVGIREYHEETCDDSCAWGRIYLFFGGSPMDTIPDWTFIGGRGNGGSNQSLASADLNGDGWSDVVFGEVYAQEGSSWYFGTVRIFFGGPTLDSLPNLIFLALPDPPGPYGPGWFGSEVSTGDLNGDGIEDLVVGDPNSVNQWPPIGLDGRVSIYWGGPGFHSGYPDVVLYGRNTEKFGASVGSGGDLNGDGIDDLVVGASDNSELYYLGGKIYIFFGGNPMDTIPDLWMYGEGAGHHLGEKNVSILKNESDYSRVAAGLPWWPSPDGGKVYILFGGNPMDNIPDMTIVGNDTSLFGIGSASAGEVNTPGYEDIIVGAPLDQNGRGVVYLYLGDSPIDSFHDASMSGRFPYPPGDNIGYEVASAGDVDGDGLDEVMVSNCPNDSLETVWVLKYLPLGVEERLDFRFPPESSSGSDFRLLQNQPNPFHSTTLIRYKIPGLSVETDLRPVSTPIPVHLAIYDITGRLVETLVNESQESGVYRVHWEGKNRGSGIYFYRLIAGDPALSKVEVYTTTKKMTLLR